MLRALCGEVMTIHKLSRSAAGEFGKQMKKQIAVLQQIADRIDRVESFQATSLP
jgi:hypothetical protein